MIASGISFPALMCASATAASGKAKLSCPPRREGIMLPMPLKGTCRNFAPETSSSMRIPRNVGLPVPADPNESLPGSRLPSATSSASVLAGTEG